MNLAQRLYEGGICTVIGLSTVFIVLIILWIVMEIMRLIFYKPNIEVVQKDAIVEETDTIQDDELEVISAITAAVAMCLNTNTSKFKIKSVRRVGSNFKR